MQLVTHLDRDHIYEMRERFAAHDMMVGEMDFVRIVKDVLPDYIVRPKDQPRGEKSASEMAGLSVLDDEEDLVANLIELYKEIDVNGDGDVRAPARESKTGGAFGRTRRMPSGRGDAAATTGVFHGEGSRRHRGSEPNRPRRSDARGQTRRWDARARPSTPPRFRAGSSAAVGRARAEASLGRVSPALDAAAAAAWICRERGGRLPRRNIRVPAAASPRLVSTDDPRPRRRRDSSETYPRGERRPRARLASSWRSGSRRGALLGSPFARRRPPPPPSTSRPRG